MFIPCPHCGFLVALIISLGNAPQACPRCKQPLDREVEPVAAGTTATVANEDPTPAADATATQSAASATEPATTEERMSAPATSAGARKPAARPERRRPRNQQTPSFIRRTAPAPLTTGPRWPGWLAVAGLTLLLVVQLLLAQRHDLAANARWRPMMSAICKPLSCDLPAWHEPAAYTMLARNVQPAAASGVLSVEASFRNDARWPQPWPTLLLSLSDVRGQPVAQRLVVPADYRGRDAGTAGELAPGQSASIRFKVREPTTPIVAFSFEFR